jgi:predicted ATPase/class 3 adenylate cyclase
MGPDPPSDAALPSGTVTFLFTDIAGSTRLLRQDRQAYGVALTEHRRLLRAAFAAGGGREVDTQGDSFFVAFPTAGQALAAAAEAQRSLASQTWPDSMPVLVRMGLHSGEATVAADGYLGLAVHRAARIAAAAAGGQVLVSESTAALVGEELPDGTALRALGEHRLKDFPEPAALYQLDISGLPTQFPPLQTLPGRPALPLPSGEFLGRDADVDALVSLLTDTRTRLVTVIGPGGIGKTRLAIETARTAADSFPGGVVFVPLSTVTDAGLLLSTVADVLGLRRETGVEPLDVLRPALGDERTLLVLDNFEQVIAARTDVAALLEASPGAVVMVTSRQALRMRSERRYPLAPLAGTPAQQLFAERAAGVSPGFVLDAGNADVVAEICRLLDGLPLAIELAAARVRLLPPAALLARLGRRLDVLGGGPIDLPERQRTLRATMDWSFGLLAPHEQSVFTRLAVFSGGWTISAAEAVCGRPDEPDVLEALAALLDASLLLESSESTGEPRLHMLATVRTYAAEKLAASPDRTEIEQGHSEWVLAMTESFWHARDRGFEEALERFDRERANLRAAVQRAVDRADVETTTLILRNTFPYLLRRDAEREAVGWLEQVLPRAMDAPAPVRGRLLVLRALFAGMVGDLAVVPAWLREGRRLLLGHADEPSDRALVAAAGTFAAMAEGSVEGLAYAAILRADLALVVGDLESAERYLGETREFFDLLGDEALVGPVLSLAGLVLLARGDVRGARHAVLDGAAVNRRSGSPTGIAYSLEGLAAVALRDGHAAAAARALAAAAVARHDVASPLWPVLTPLVDELTARSRAALGDQAEPAVVEGRQSDLRQVLTRTLDELADTPQSSATGSLRKR